MGKKNCLAPAILLVVILILSAVNFESEPVRTVTQIEMEQAVGDFVLLVLGMTIVGVLAVFSVVATVKHFKNGNSGAAENLPKVFC